MIDAGSQYFKQVQLLIRVLPLVTEEACFAVKGGTAINLFVRDLPRLSVDIDLVYVPIEERELSLSMMDAALGRMSARIESMIAGIQVTHSRMHGTGVVSKLMLDLYGVRVKVEVNPVLRGLVHAPELLPVQARVEEQFGFAEARIASFTDLYGGKICAALDRQHPRDLFDVGDLLRHEGLTPELINVFLVYVISHPRPIAELLQPNFKELSVVYMREFAGMTTEPCELDALIEIRRNLVEGLGKRLSQSHKDFLRSFKFGEPQWDLLGLSDVPGLPAVQWKLQNIRNMQEAKRGIALEKLEAVLQGMC